MKHVTRIFTGALIAVGLTLTIGLSIASMARQSSGMSTRLPETELSSYHYFSMIYTMKLVLPSEVFMEKILPEVEKSLADGIINYEEWVEIEAIANKAEQSNQVKVDDRFLELLRSQELGVTIGNFINDVEKGAGLFGKDLKKELDNLFNNNEKKSSQDDEVTSL